MERNILFRAKTLDDNVWVYGAYYTEQTSANEDLHYINGTKYTFDPIQYDVDPKTVGQYTGIKDKNGTKIFEHDLVRFTREGNNFADPTRLVVIKWSNAQFVAYSPDCCPTCKRKTNGSYASSFGEALGIFKEVLVVGNLIDNASDNNQ